MTDLIVQLVTILGPLVLQVIADHKAQTGSMPTNEQMIAFFQANADKYLAEGAAWSLQHPKGPTP